MDPENRRVGHLRTYLPDKALFSILATNEMQTRSNQNIIHANLNDAPAPKKHGLGTKWKQCHFHVQGLR